MQFQCWNWAKTTEQLLQAHPGRRWHNRVKGISASTKISPPGLPCPTHKNSDHHSYPDRHRKHHQLKYHIPNWGPLENLKQSRYQSHYKNAQKIQDKPKPETQKGKLINPPRFNRIKIEPLSPAMTRGFKKRKKKR